MSGKDKEVIMEQIFPWKECFCGSTSFYIQKPGKWWKIVCRKCKCERQIKSPGTCVEEYTVSIPFKKESEGGR